MSTRGLQLFTAMSLVWGIPYLFIRIAVVDMPPAAVILGRTLVASVILLPIALRSRGLRRVVRRWRPLLAFTLLEMALPWYLITTAEETASSSFSGMMIATVPLLAAVVGIARGDAAARRPAVLAGLLLGFAGVAVMGGGDFRGVGAAATLELLAAALCYAIGPIVLERYLSDLPGPTVMSTALLGCAAVYLPLALLGPIRVPSSAALVAIVALGVACTAFAFVAYSALIVEIGPVRAVVITYINPAVAMALGVAVLGERLSFAMIGALALVLIGSAAATHQQGATRASSNSSQGAAADPPGHTEPPRRPRTAHHRFPRAAQRLPFSAPHGPDGAVVAGCDGSACD